MRGVAEKLLGEVLVREGYFSKCSSFMGKAKQILTQPVELYVLEVPRRWQRSGKQGFGTPTAFLPTRISILNLLGKWTLIAPMFRFDVAAEGPGTAGFYA